MGEGTKELLALKYYVTHEGAKLKVKELQNNVSDEQEYKDSLSKLEYIEYKISLLNRMNV